MSIVVAASDSPLGRRALDRALAEARLYGTSLILVSAVPTPRSREDALEHTELREQRRVWLEERAARMRGGGVEVRTYLPPTPSDLPDAVLEAADQPGAELIVLGIPRRSRVGKAVLGSDAQEILLRSHLPVLGVKLPVDQEL